MGCTREIPELTLKSILGAILSKIWMGRKWKMMALLHEEEENREQRCECGGGKCWEKEKETKETGRSTFCWCFPGNMRTALTKIS